ncbi:hypothetical protein FGO68_gene16868 [Halteria grandinella]|uniref:Uncharacterized protein n=1 Tax=Halteria grandinella TaxID=5974 RepID=A0A8J8NBZ8_HALGN|nr:hypothetical protein FGO68_gene16868 [Halteria grandinella]
MSTSLSEFSLFNRSFSSQIDPYDLQWDPAKTSPSIRSHPSPCERNLHFAWCKWMSFLSSIDLHQACAKQLTEAYSHYFSCSSRIGYFSERRQPFP